MSTFLASNPFISLRGFPFNKVTHETHLFMLGMSSTAVRQDCAHLLGQGVSGYKRTIQSLLRGLSDTDILVRKACSHALVQLGQRFP